MMRAVILTLLLVANADVRGQFTDSATGCPCNYNTSSLACACCSDNGCQCPLLSETSSQTCVECGSEEQCPSDLERTCTFVNAEGCFMAPVENEGIRRVFSDAGVYCATQEGHLPNIKRPVVYEAIRDYATQRDWDRVWSGARVRDFDWQWSRSLSHVLLQGCFTDIPDSPDLSYLVYTDNNITAESCIEECRGRDYLYAGVQFVTVSTQGTVITTSPSCRCDNEQGLGSEGEGVYYLRPLDDCNQPCVAGQATGFACGAHNRQLVFRVGGTDYEAWDYADTSEAYCAMLNTTKQRWQKMNCTTPSNHVCEYPELSEEDCNSATNHQWRAVRCITIHTDASTWHDATRHCGRLGGFLVQIDNEELHNNLSNLLGGTDVLWWIGLTNRQLTWTDGTAVTTMAWAAGEPDLQHEHDICVSLDKARQYRGKMKRCSERNNIICQLVYGWTDSDYQDYINYYDTLDDNFDSSNGEGGGGGGAGGGGGNNQSATAPTSDDSGGNDDEGGSGRTLYIGIGIGAAVIVIVVVLFVIIIIRQRKFHSKKEKLQSTGESNSGFSGPGLSRGESYYLTRQDTVYERIDDSYERLEGAVGNGVPASYAGLRQEGAGYMGLGPDQTSSKEAASYQQLPDPNAPKLPPRPEAGYAGLAVRSDYVIPSQYAGLVDPEETGYAGLRTKHIDGATTDSTYASTGETEDAASSENTEKNQRDAEVDGNTENAGENRRHVDTENTAEDTPTTAGKSEYLEVIANSRNQ